MKREDVSKIFEGATEEQINQILNINSADIGNAKQKAETERDGYKAQLDTAQTALKEFEGVDVKELQVKIDKLNGDLTAKENEYKAKIADMEFDGKLDGLLSKAGAKSVKAVKALLDVDSLKKSQNQDTDLQAAIDSCKEENGFLFGSDEPFNNPVAPTGGNPPSNPLASIRAAMGLNKNAE